MWDETASAWNTTPEVVENFTLTSGVGRDTMVHDAAGNLTYDGLDKYYYDAWNRLARVSRAYRDSGGELQAGSQIAAMSYDALGRRVIKNITNSGDWDCKYMYYFDGTLKVEKRNASGCTLARIVHTRFGNCESRISNLPAGRQVANLTRTYGFSCRTQHRNTMFLLDRQDKKS